MTEKFRTLPEPYWISKRSIFNSFDGCWYVKDGNREKPLGPYTSRVAAENIAHQLDERDGIVLEADAK
jgi:hypothetical protein